jgi:serine/threonine protein kinase
MENEYQPKFDNIEVIKHLYSTKLSKVWLVKHLNDYCILKGKDIKTIANGEYTQLKRERAFLETTKHRQFPHFIKALKDDNYLYLLLTFFEGCALSSLLLDKLFCFNTFKHFDEFMIKKKLYLYLIIQVIEVVDNLHQDHIVFRDLKMNNLIINEKLELSLIDFGLIKQIDDKTRTVCGTYHIMAPEMLKNKFNEPEDYSFGVDIYSYGIFIYELFVGKPPFNYVYDFSDEYLKSYYDNITKGLDDSHFDKFYEYSSEYIQVTTFIYNLKDLIKKCLVVNPSQRCTINDIKSHSVFEERYNEYRSYSLTNNELETKIIDYIEFNGDFEKDYIYKSEDPFDLYF